MNRFLVDTHWVVSFLNRRPDAVTLFSELADEGIAVSVVTVGEVLEGLLALAAHVRRRAQFEELLASVDVLPISRDSAERFAAARYELRRRGEPIPDNDLWIAACALADDLTLVSRDQHFGRVPDLKLRN